MHLKFLHSHHIWMTKAVGFDVFLVQQVLQPKYTSEIKQKIHLVRYMSKIWFFKASWIIFSIAFQLKYICINALYTAWRPWWWLEVMVRGVGDRCEVECSPLRARPLSIRSSQANWLNRYTPWITTRGWLKSLMVRSTRHLVWYASFDNNVRQVKNSL